MTERLVNAPGAAQLGKADIGVVLIHGIGNIEAGEMATNFAHGLTITSQRDPDQHLIPTRQGEQLYLNADDRTVRFYDAYWSTLIQEARQPFDFHWVRRVAWFPWLNMTNRQYDTRFADAIRAVLWWPILMLALVGLQLMYRGAVVVVSVWFTITAGFRSGVRVRDQAKDLGGNLGDVVNDFRKRLPSKIQDRRDQGIETAISAQKSIDRRLRIVGDVFVYVSSAALEHGTSGPSCAQRIDGLFLKTLENAAKDCTELHIIAHSLGTVITDRCLTHAAIHPGRYRWISKVTHVHTMGCPLEKIRFFWPMVLHEVKEMPREETLNIRWTNFADPLDMVSGRLTHFDRWGPVENVRLWGLGGPATAHSKALYQRHVQFQQSMADRILRQFYPLPRRAVFRSLQAGKTILETLLVLGASAVVVAIGFVSIAVGPAISLGWAIDEVGWSPWMIAALVSIVPLVLALTSYEQAKVEHQRFIKRGVDQGALRETP